MRREREQSKATMEVATRQGEGKMVTATANNGLVTGRAPGRYGLNFQRMSGIRPALGSDYLPGVC